MSETDEDTTDHMDQLDGDTSFSAADSATGYLYQCRYALLETLRRYREGSDYTVALETLDDVVITPSKKSLTLLQTKHHLKGEGNLTDAGADVWKTLRVWCEGLDAGRFPDTTVFYLVTTETAPPGSAAFYLRPKDRDEDKAFKQLTDWARKSKSKKNAKAFAAFLKSESTSKTVLKSMTVFDGSKSIVDVPKLLQKEMRAAVSKKFIGPFLTRLEGWWYQRVIEHLCHGAEDPILSQEVEDQIDRLREQFSIDNLPIDDEIRDAEIDKSINTSLYMDDNFVRQLRLIRIQNQRILIAIREYFRAFEQRSRWLREDLLHLGELGRYETRLIDEWRLLFARMRENLGETATEERKIELARAIYDWDESHVGIPIRRKCDEPFITRGSFHILANELRLGWHPDFFASLYETLDRAEAGA